MGDFANGYINRIIAILLSVLVIGINIFFVATQVNNASLSAGWIVLIGDYRHNLKLLLFNLQFIFLHFSVIFAICYIAFNFYLVVHMCCSMGNSRLLQYSFVQKYVLKNSSSLLEDATNTNSYSR